MWIEHQLRETWSYTPGRRRWRLVERMAESPLGHQVDGSRS
jgi:hypothetical protein